MDLERLGESELLKVQEGKEDEHKEGLASVKRKFKKWDSRTFNDTKHLARFMCKVGGTTRKKKMRNLEMMGVDPYVIDYLEPTQIQLDVWAHNGKCHTCM